CCIITPGKPPDHAFPHTTASCPRSYADCSVRTSGRLGGASDKERWMPRPTVTLDLPPEVYNQLQQRAQRHRRRLEEEASLALAAAVSTPTVPPDDLETVLNALTTLDDDTLWQVSHSQPTVEDGILLQALVDKRRRIGLTPAE